MLQGCLALCLLLTFCLVQPVAAGHAGPGPMGHGGHMMNRYRPDVRDLDEWLQSLSPVQQAKAKSILEETRPRIKELRKRIQNKMVELESLSYDQETSPETLPRLGRELQLLRDELRAELLHMDDRMLREVGDSLGPPATRGCRMGHHGLPNLEEEE